MVLEALDGVNRSFSALRAVPAQAGDRLLLCSDGITDYLTDDELAELLKVPAADVAVRRLADTALDRGSRDNVTAVIADVAAGPNTDDGWLNALPAPSDLAE